MASCLGLSAHPFQFPPIEVVGAGNLRTGVVDTFLMLVKIIRIVAAIGIDGAVVEFQDNGANSVEEETVVSDHQERAVASVQIAFQPLNHFKVEMVGGLVENDEVGLRNQHIGQGYPLLLASRELSHGLVKVLDFQLGKYLLGLQYLLGLSLMVETGIEHALFGVENGCLLEHSHTQIAPVDNLSVVVAFLSRKDRKQGRLSRSVLGNESHLLSFGYRERDILEQHLGAERFRKVLDI